jgi:hypothetical protein
VTSTRAILVSREEAYDLIGGTEVPRRYDNAGDQPRWEICTTHMGRIRRVRSGWLCTGFEGAPEAPCRVVTAIVVALDEEARS